MATYEGQTIVVFGATGAQGSAVADAVLRTFPAAKVRTVTRNARSAAAVAKGEAYAKFSNWAGWTEADTDKPETLPAAFAGASAAWLVTNFWEHLDGAREEAQGRALVDAASATGVATVVYSGLDSPMKRMGITGVHHFEHKYNVERHLFEAPGITNRISVRIAYYHTNVLHFSPFQRVEGRIAAVYPLAGAPLKMAHLRDYGETVALVLARPADFHTRNINVVSDFLTAAQIAEAVSAATGVPVAPVEVPTAVYAAFGFPGAADLAAMFEFNSKCGLEADDEPVLPRDRLTRFADWARDNADALRAYLAKL